MRAFSAMARLTASLTAAASDRSPSGTRIHSVAKPFLQTATAASPPSRTATATAGALYLAARWRKARPSKASRACPVTTVASSASPATGTVRKPLRSVGTRQTMPHGSVLSQGTRRPPGPRTACTTRTQPVP